MFSKLKQFKELRDQAKNIQAVLSEERTTKEKNGIEVVMDGNMQILSINIKDDITKDEIAKRLPDVLNTTIKETQKKMALKMQQMGGFPGM